jgi:hypothetical protein
MKIEVPFTVTYDSKRVVPLDDVIDSLVAIRAMLNEATDLLPDFDSSVSLDGFYVSVNSVTQHSPLREIFLVALFVAFQDDIESAVGEAYNAMSGQELAAHYETLLSLVAMIVIYYGVGLAKDVITRSVADGPSKKALYALAQDVSEMTGKPADQILKNLQGRYEKEGRRSGLIKSVTKFFVPSKRDNNSPIKVGKRTIPTEILLEAPEAHLLENAMEERQSRDQNDVRLEIHAMDKDRSRSGWAATADGISSRRLPLKLFDGVEPSQIWGRDFLRANITTIYQWDGIDFQPREIHIRSVVR